ncbi:hypothetical protein FOL47_002877 [Perkinsus chesapeaki]|uniref:Amino acid transporter transmembrane domain-containing protein n=1 Tax=Perkinsus chesapeaki TaxID=330153 RepID=A0A7J6MBJ4_PERCH|nr:hypothetical protein FOL47_002877 [Perkinsus chesapeaki]
MTITSPCTTTPLLSSKLLPDNPFPKPPPGFFDAGSVFCCSTLLFTASVGSGVLALPSAAKQAGLGLGILFLVCAGLISATSNWILSNAVTVSGQRTYGSVLAWAISYIKTGGTRQGFPLQRLHAFDAFMVLNQAASIVTYLIFLGDFLPSVFLTWTGIPVNRTLVLVIISYVVVLPFSISSEISSLRAVGSFSMWVMFATAILAVCKTPWGALGGQHHLETNSAALEGVTWQHAMQALSLGTFAFMNQVNAVCITAELHKPTPARQGIVCISSSACLFLCYATLMACVYLTFGQATTSNFLQNYPVDDSAVNACRVAVSLMLIFACPLNLFPVTSSFFHAIERCDLESNPRVRSAFNLVVLTVCLVAAIWVPDVGSFIGFVSAYMSTPLMMTLPAFIYIVCCRVEDATLSKEQIPISASKALLRRSCRLAIPAILLAVSVLLWTAATVNLFGGKKS